MDVMGQSVSLVINPINVNSYLHDGGSGLRLNEGPGLKFSLVDQFLMLVAQLGGFCWL